MAFHCIKNSIHDCVGCMACKPESHYYCPVCGEEVYDTVYVNTGGDIVGCENCTEIKEPYEVFDDEIN